jgi:hypothetical protein
LLTRDAAIVAVEPLVAIPSRLDEHLEQVEHLRKQRVIKRVIKRAIRGSTKGTPSGHQRVKYSVGPSECQVLRRAIGDHPPS